MKKLIILFSAVFIAFSVSSAEAKDKESYSSKRTLKATDENGTEYKNQVTTDTDVDKNGDESTTVKTESTTDPEGLGNKTTVKTKRTKKRKGDMVESTYKKDVNGKTVEEEKTSE